MTQRTIKGGMNWHAEGTRKDKKGNTIIKRKDAQPDARNRKKCPQKVLFVDQCLSDQHQDKQMIASVVIVESFKKYN